VKGKSPDNINYDSLPNQIEHNSCTTTEQMVI